MESGRQARQRRGGHDGLVSNTAFSGLPEALPVAVEHEAVLRSELERLPGRLEPSVDWTQRVDALLWLEGLVQGGATDFAAFPELLLGVRDSLAAQMQERRSAVSRQACRTICVLAAACGISFEPLAVHLLPVVFKTLAMGIQIVSEAAEACMHAMLAACPSPRLLPKLCSVVTGDRNGRLRQSAAEFLLHAVEGWEPAAYERQLESVERALLAAVQDAQAETRVVGRNLYGAYTRSWPAQAHAMLAREKDRQLQDKLMAAAEEYVPGMTVLPEGPRMLQPVSRRASLGNCSSDTPPGGPPHTSAPGCLQQGGAVRMVPLVPRLMLTALNSTAESTRQSQSHSSSARSLAPAASAGIMSWQQLPATARENQPDNRVAPIQATPRHIFPKTRARREAAAAAGGDEVETGHLATSARERQGAARRSIGGAALRASVASFKRHQKPEEVPELPGCQVAAPQSTGLGTLQRLARLQHGSLRAPLPALPLPQMAVAELEEDAELSARPSGLEAQADGFQEESDFSGSIPMANFQPQASREEAASGGTCQPASLVPLLSQLCKSGLAWSDRVAMFQAVQATLEQSSNSNVVAIEVASNIDRLVAALLEGSGDAHFRVAAAALGATGAGLASTCSRTFEPHLDRLLTALFARVVDPKEQIRTLVDRALMAALTQHSADVVISAVARSLQANRAPRVKCAVMDFFAAAVCGSSEGQQGVLHQRAGTGSALCGLLRHLLQLTADKNRDIRRSAAEAVKAAYHSVDSQAVLNALHSLPPADLLMVQRSIGPLFRQPQQEDSRVAQAVPAPLPPRARSRTTDSAAICQQPGPLTSQGQHSEGSSVPPQLGHHRQESSSSLPCSSQHGSSANLSSPGACKVQTTAPGPAAAEQHTPGPPSPFMWRVQFSSPLVIAADALDVPASAADPPSASGAATQVETATQLGADLPSAGRVPSGILVPNDDVTVEQLEMLLAQLQAGPSAENLRDVSRLAQKVPTSAWPSHVDQIVAALCAVLSSNRRELLDAGLQLARDLAAAAPPSLFLPSLPSLLPIMLACAAEQDAREVVLAADEALEALLLRAPPQSCLGVLVPRLPAVGDVLSTDQKQGAQLHATIRSLRRVVGHMQPTGLTAHLQPLLLPGLCAAFRSPLTDVRKATVDCLVAIWLVVGDAIKPHLGLLSASELKLLEVYQLRACAKAG